MVRAGGRSEVGEAVGVPVPNVGSGVGVSLARVVVPGDSVLAAGSPVSVRVGDRLAAGSVVRVSVGLG
jgi:hypothetical protein